MLVALALMSLGLIGDAGQILCDDQHVSSKMPHAKKVKPLPIRAITSPAKMLPPAIIQQIELDNLMRQMNITGKISGHFTLDVNHLQFAIKKKQFRGILSLYVGGGEVIGDKLWIDLFGTSLPVPSSVLVRYAPDGGIRPQFLVIFQVASVSGLGPHPRVLVGEITSGIGGISTNHPLQTGAYAAVYDPNQYFAGVLMLQTNAGMVQLSEVDVYAIENQQPLPARRLHHPSGAVPS